MIMSIQKYCMLKKPIPVIEYRRFFYNLYAKDVRYIFWRQILT